MNKVVSETKVVVTRDHGTTIVFIRCLLDNGRVLWFFGDWTPISASDQNTNKWLNDEYAKLS